MACSVQGLYNQDGFPSAPSLHPESLLSPAVKKAKPQSLAMDLPSHRISSQNCGFCSGVSGCGLLKTTAYKIFNIEEAPSSTLYLYSIDSPVPLPLPNVPTPASPKRTEAI